MDSSMYLFIVEQEYPGETTEIGRREQSLPDAEAATDFINFFS